jgi:2-desacetyl-2-hydroxyethyl bacteriochlorophyllide A dehydrogenase
LKALVLHGKEDLRVEEVEEPIPLEGWVKLKVEEVGICGTDKAFYKGTYRPLKLPIIPGHEISGIVVDVGKGVSKDLIGRRVTTEINISCGKCWFCKHGMPTQCPYRKTVGISIDGGMAEYMITSASVLHFIDDLTPAQGAMVEPLAAVLEAVQQLPPPPGANIAVLGIGTIGLLSIQVLRLFGPRILIGVSRPGSPKAKVAERLGVDEVLTYSEALDLMRRKTPEGQGFDYVVEATGSASGVEMALNMVRPRGVIIAKSTHGERVSLDYTSLIVKEVLLVGSRCGPFPPAIRLLREGLVKVEPLITDKLPLTDGVNAFKKAFSREAIKIHLIPS